MTIDELKERAEGGKRAADLNKTASCPNRSLPRAPNRADAQSIPIIALTAGAFHEAAQRGMRAAVRDA